MTQQRSFQAGATAPCRGRIGAGFRHLVLACALVAGCGQRGDLDLQPVAAPGDTETVMIATSRMETADGQFGTGRSEVLHYLSLDIAVPPLREKGEIEFRGRGKLDPLRQFYASARTDFRDAAAFRNALARALRRPETGGEAIIYVHGYNNTFAEGVYRIAQLSHDFGLDGVSVHYSWASAGSPLGYEFDRDSVLAGRDGLERLIESVRASGAKRILIVAHSMGALLTMEALRQLEIGRPGYVTRTIRGVVLQSPDIDLSVFRSQVRRIGTLPQPFAIFVSRKDRALTLSAFLSGQPQRLGNLISAESVSDLKVTVIDVTDFSEGIGHFTAGTSPALIEMLSRAGEVDAAFRGEGAARTGLLPGVILTIERATELVLSPITPKL